MKTKTAFLFTFLMLFGVFCSVAQTLTIEGVVTDEDGLPLGGVNITKVGTSQGVSTDFDGNYTIEASEGEKLKFSSTGFEDQVITVGTDTEINVLLKMGTTLDEVVVTAFGRQLTRNELTSSVSTVSSEELTKTPFTDFQQSLTGKVPGLTVNVVSGDPGAAPEIRIRGANSISASNAPLYVIDGVPVRYGSVAGNSEMTSMNVLSLVNTDDIESISVLKDASAVAPYGADGSNGVILITTKSGKSGKAKFSLNMSTGFNNDAVSGFTSLNAEEKLDAVIESFYNSYGPLGDNSVGSMDEAYDKAYNALVRLRTWENNGRPESNWNDLVRIKNAPTSNLTFSVSNGSENANFYASLGYKKQEGTAIGTGYKRISGHLKYNQKLLDNLNLNISTNVSNADQTGIYGEDWTFNPNMVRYYLTPWAPSFNDDGTPRIDDFNDYSSWFNVLYTTENDSYRNNVLRGTINTQVDFEIAKNLTFNTRLGLEYILTYYEGYENPIHSTGAKYEGDKEESAERTFNYTTQNSLDYKFKLGESHNFNVTALQEFTKYKDNYLYAYGEVFPNAFLTNLSAASANFEATSRFSDRMSIRYIGMLNYNFNHKYLIDATYSYQGDSRFSKQFGNFYSIGLGWNLHEESFMQNLDAVDVLRLRGGYGVTGNAGLGRNQYQPLMGYGRYNDKPAIALTGFGTTATWEKGNKLDFGADFELFDKRLNGSIEYFHNKSIDMLFNVPLALSATYSDGAVLQNLGEMTNKGIELSLHGDIIRTENFSWNLGGQLSTLKSMVTKLSEDAEVLGSRSIIQGHMLREWYMPEWAGVNPDNGLPEWYVDRSVNDDKTSNYSEAKNNFTGYNAYPTFTGSLSTRLDFKNLFVEGMLYFSGGNKIFENYSSNINSTAGNQLSTYNTTTFAYENAWRNPGDNALFPRLDYLNQSVRDQWNTSTRRLHDGDYMRLRDLAIGYRFDQKALENVSFIDNATISVRGTNLWTWVKDKSLKWDPEISNSGYTELYTPPVKSILLNVNINF